MNSQDYTEEVRLFSERQGPQGCTRIEDIKRRRIDRWKVIRVQDEVSREWSSMDQSAQQSKTQPKQFNRQPRNQIKQDQ